MYLLSLIIPDLAYSWIMRLYNIFPVLNTSQYDYKTHRLLPIQDIANAVSINVDMVVID